MVRKDRFVIIAKVRVSDYGVDDVVIGEYGHYPTHEELQAAWEKTKPSFERLYFMRVEKQTRFEEGN